jgi:tetratricopeptide (TPR) repeat protein
LFSIEIALRLVGYGHPTSFFLRTQIDGKEFFVPNDKFTSRFFPPSIGRPPPALRLAVEKPADMYRIFLFGESAALGDPEPSQGVGRQLEVLLHERYPGTHFEVVCTAMTAINSHTIVPLARECAAHQGDLWIIYTGNNEIIGPFGAGTAFGPRAPAMPFIRASLAVKTTRIGQLIEALVARLDRRSPTPKSWASMKMFTEHQVPQDDPARLRVYKHFGKNLEDILQAGLKQHVPIILSTLADNIKDCAPFGSMHRTGLDEIQKTSWEKSFQDGVALESAGNYPQALAAYTNASGIDAQFAELQFRIARCDLALTNYPEARRHFELARDYDTLAFRADSRINEAIKDAASRHVQEGVYLLDAAETAAQASPGGITGNELFYEHVHWKFEGNYLLARAMADQVAALLPDAVRKNGSSNWVPADVCAQRLAVTDWDRYRAWEAIAHRMSEPPFTAQLNHDENFKWVENVLREMQSHITPETTVAARKTYQDAIVLAPDDHFLHENYAVFLEATGDLNGALKETERVRGLLPQLPMPWFYSGLLLVQLGRSSEAANCFSHMLSLRDDFVPAINELAEIFANQQKTAEARALFRRALQTDPGFAATYVNLGFMEQTQGDAAQALAQYQAAARLQPHGPYELFSQACELISAQRRDEAIECLRAAVRMDPKFWQARYTLGTELAAQNNVAEAGSQFAEVIRYRPDYAKAHSNLGVALANQGKLEQALTEFRAALQLNPDNKLARQNIESIETAKQRIH